MEIFLTSDSHFNPKILAGFKRHHHGVRGQPEPIGTTWMSVAR